MQGIEEGGQSTEKIKNAEFDTIHCHWASSRIAASKRAKAGADCSITNSVSATSTSISRSSRRIICLTGTFVPSAYTIIGWMVLISTGGVGARVVSSEIVVKSIMDWDGVEEIGCGRIGGRLVKSRLRRGEVGGVVVVEEEE